MQRGSSRRKMSSAVTSRNVTQPLSTARAANRGPRLDRLLLRWSDGRGWPCLGASPLLTLAAVYRDDTENFYDLLGVPTSGSLVEIKKAYKQLARKYHPDVSPLDRREENSRRFIEVKEAYDSLSDPVRRALYDRHLAARHHPPLPARRRSDEEQKERSDWREVWHGQLAELQRRSMNDNKDNLSWGALMRRRRVEASEEEVP